MDLFHVFTCIIWLKSCSRGAIASAIFKATNGIYGIQYNYSHSAIVKSHAIC